MITEPPLLSILGRNTPTLFEDVILAISYGPIVGSSGRPAITADKNSVLSVDPLTFVASSLNLTLSPFNARGIAKVYSNK